MKIGNARTRTQQDATEQDGTASTPILEPRLASMLANASSSNGRVADPAAALGAVGSFLAMQGSTASATGRGKVRVYRERDAEVPVRLDSTERAIRADAFAADLSSAIMHFDRVTRRGGPMVLEVEGRSASLKGGGTGSTSLFRTTENSVEWVQRITEHWTGYLEENGVSLKAVS